MCSWICKCDVEYVFVDLQMWCGNHLHIHNHKCVRGFANASCVCSCVCKCVTCVFVDLHVWLCMWRWVCDMTHARDMARVDFLCVVRWILSVCGRSYQLCTATHCNTLKHTATHCNTLQHIATHCNTLQHTATHCNTLQHTATHRNTPQHTATQYADVFVHMWM